MSSPDRMSVTVIGGYLGAGKTTLLNKLLRDADEPIAVLVNDFGDVNIDVDLIEARSENTIELSNGCICCSMVDGFSAALDTIAELDPRPARLVIEASGVADPAQVAAYGHGPGLALDAVIVVVDAETIRTAVDDAYVGQTVSQQLASAEVLVLNKADLVDDAELDAVVDWLKERCPDAYVTTTTNAEVAPEVLFGRPSQSAPLSGHDHHHHPEQIFTTSTWAPDGPVTRDAIAEMMADLGPLTVRAKGLVELQGETNPFVLQRVGQRWSLRRSPSPWPDQPATRVVTITVG